eukprot:79441-Pleurochrysis_carterae.AAC.1
MNRKAAKRSKLWRYVRFEDFARSHMNYLPLTPNKAAWNVCKRDSRMWGRALCKWKQAAATEHGPEGKATSISIQWDARINLGRKRIQKVGSRLYPA